jgi:hypothetical protein
MPHHDHSTGNIEHDIKGRLPSPVPSIAYTTETEMSLGRSDLDQPLKDGLPALTEITFRPRSRRSWAFTAVFVTAAMGMACPSAGLLSLSRALAMVESQTSSQSSRYKKLLLTGICYYPAS